MRKRWWLGLILLLGLFRAEAESCLEKYQSLAKAYYSLQKSEQKKYHHNWEKLIEKFQALANAYPSCSKADDAQFMVGRLWYECYLVSGLYSDAINSLSAFYRVVEKYPKSSLSDDALLYRGKIYLKLNKTEQAGDEFKKILSEYPQGDCVKSARKYLKSLSSKSPPPEKAPLRSNDAIALILSSGNPELTREPGNKNLAKLIQIRYWSAPSYTRVVFDLDRKTSFSAPHLLKPDPELGTPPRLYIDLYQTRLGEEFAQNYPYKNRCYELPIGDGLLKRARAGQYQPEVVRVVLDMESIQEFKYFTLPASEDAGFRIVIDVYGKKTRPSAPETRIPSPPSSPKKPAPKKSLVIVIDPGHGGKDPGAVGPYKTREKDVVLKISRYLAQELKAIFPQAKIILTRYNDRYLSLVERTAKANALEADLFISIHCNANPDRRAYGIETYYLDNTTDRAVLRLAARENFVSEKIMESAGSEINQILADLATTSKVNESIPLAKSIQKELVKTLSQKYSYIKDLGVKKAPFWVLTGAVMPCVLVEVSFISNPREEKRLASSSYQKLVARGIARGVKSWLKTSGTLTSVVY